MRRARQAAEVETAWTATGNPAVEELLDHIARELAAEYVRLLRDEQDQQTAPKEVRRK